MVAKLINVNDLVRFLRDEVEKQESRVVTYIRQEGESRRVNLLSTEIDGMNMTIRMIEQFVNNPDNMIFEVGIVKKGE